jgi:hypothetical protein
MVCGSDSAGCCCHTEWRAATVLGPRPACYGDKVRARYSDWIQGKPPKCLRRRSSWSISVRGRLGWVVPSFRSSQARCRELPFGSHANQTPRFLRRHEPHPSGRGWDLIAMAVYQKPGWFPATSPDRRGPLATGIGSASRRHPTENGWRSQSDRNIHANPADHTARSRRGCRTLCQPDARC